MKWLNTLWMVIPLRVPRSCVKSKKQTRHDSNQRQIKTSGHETRVATSEYSGKEYQYSRAYLDDGTEYSISATDHGDFFWVLITINNSKDNTIPRKMCERIRSLAFERGLTLSRNKLSDKITGGNLVVNDMLNGVVISIENE